MDIKLFVTNDVHSHFHNYFKIKNYLKAQKMRFNDACLYIDVGDHVDRAHPLTEATLGKRNIQELNDAECDVATIGNNEGITLSKNQLKSLYNTATFDVICANLREIGSDTPYFKPYVIKKVKGVTIGFIALTVAFTPFYKALDWEVDDVFHWASYYIKKLRPQVDILVMMSHLGKYDDETLAHQFSEIDVILGSHTHHHFLEGDYVEGTLISASGRYGEFLGEITLTVKNGVLVNKRARLIEVDMLNEVEDESYEEGRKQLHTRILNDALPVTRPLYSTNRFMVSLMEAARKKTNCDVVVMHAGIIAAPFSGGPLTDYHIHKMLPHAINLVKIELSGRELKEVYMLAKAHAYKDEIFRGLGFRGDIFGIFLTHNLGEIESKHQYFIGEKLIDDKKTYHLCTLDMYTFGRIFPQFKANKKEYIMPEFLRDIAKSYKYEIFS